MRNGEMRDHEVRFLVIDKDTIDEAAWIYSTKHIQPKETPFEDEIRQKIPQFQSLNPIYEKIIITSMREAEEIAELLVYKYNSETDVSERLELVVFKKDDEITIRKLG